jgi:SnoaL-like domain
MHEHPIAVWHRLVQTRNPSGLGALLADEVVFYSPVVHTPQRGKALTAMYLSAAFEVFFNQNFRYVREIRGPTDALLEFETVVEGIEVNGIDLIKWNESGEIVEFKVMIRPLKAINVIHQKMASMLELLKQNREA